MNIFCFILVGLVYKIEVIKELPGSIYSGGQISSSHEKTG